MADMPMSPVALHGAKTCTEDSHNATGAAGWLGFAAAPIFAILALWTALSGTEPGMLCMGMQGASPLNGMALMSVFHAAPWMTSRRIGALRSYYI